MRIATLALLLAAPAAALAQTPRDIAQQVWPFGPPASANSAPVTPLPAGGFTPRDLARLTWPGGAPISRLHAPCGAYVSAFNGAAIEGLRSTPQASSVAALGAFMTVAR